MLRTGINGLVLALASCVALGCSVVGRELRGGITRYEVGHYNAAERHCGELDQVHDELSDKAHVRYLVYCGLTQYKLGNRGDAKHLLTEGASEYEQGNDGWLKPRIVNELYKALDDLDGSPHERPYSRRERSPSRTRPIHEDEDAALRTP